MNPNFGKVILLIALIVSLVIPTIAQSLYTCPTYTIYSSTSSATSGYATCTYTAQSSGTIVIQTCNAATGDTYLRIYINGNFVLNIDDGCTANASIGTVTVVAGDVVTIHEGCYSSYTCSGTVSISVGTNAPTPAPTPNPTMQPTPNPTMQPTRNIVVSTQFSNTFGITTATFTVCDDIVIDSSSTTSNYYCASIKSDGDLVATETTSTTTNTIGSCSSDNKCNNFNNCKYP